MPKRTRQTHAGTARSRKATGRMRMASGAYEGPYSFQSRFEEGDGTNPEELIAAAHAGCFSMALSGDLGPGRPRAGERRDDGDACTSSWATAAPTIARIDLDTRARVPESRTTSSRSIAEGAKQNCPVSRALAAVPTIELNAELVE